MAACGPTFRTLDDTHKGLVQCQLCRFWSDTDNDGEGQCRRSSPLLVPYTNVQFYTSVQTHYSAWPMTDADEWCGEFRPKDKPATFPHPDEWDKAVEMPK